MKDTADQTFFFYADESWIEMEGKKHLILGAITTAHPGQMALELTRLRKDLGLEPLDEVKWNTDRLTEEQRHKLSDGMIGLIRRSTGLISIVEGNDKQHAAELLAVQAADYCTEHKIPTYVLCFDQGLLPRPKQFAEYLRGLKEPACIGLQVVDSSFDQLIQCADIFIGFYRAAMRQELERRTKYIPNTDESFDDIRIASSLTEYVLLGTRGMLWGNTELLTEELIEGKFPLLRSTGLGFRIHSSISADTRKLLEERIATVYMGCLH